MDKKKKDPTTSPITHQRKQLAEWLAEWELDRTLREADAPEHEAGPTPSRKSLSYEGIATTHSVGEVSLYHPLADEAPLYVLNMEERDDRLLLAPFSRFSVPAIPGEWTTGQRTQPLRVLCLWNARWVARTALRPLWVVRHLPARALGEAGELYRCLTEGSAIPSRLAVRCGPPLVHPLDPRHAYIEEEMARFLSLQPDFPLGSQTVLEDPARYLGAPIASNLLQAAEPPGAYGAGSRLYRVPSFSALILVRPGPAQSRVLLREMDGRLCLRAEGGRFVDADGQGSAPIHEGAADMPFGDPTVLEEINGARHPIMLYDPLDGAP